MSQNTHTARDRVYLGTNIFGSRKSESQQAESQREEGDRKEKSCTGYLVPSLTSGSAKVLRIDDCVICHHCPRVDIRRSGSVMLLDHQPLPRLETYRLLVVYILYYTVPRLPHVLCSKADYPVHACETHYSTGCLMQ